MSAQHSPGRLIGADENGRFNSDHEWSAAHESATFSSAAPLWLDGEVAALVVDAGDDFMDRTNERARRLVACWNACEGVPTEVLEAQQSGGLPWSVADQIEQRVQFDAYKEGSEEAFGAVVEQKRKAEECVSRMESTIQSQQGVIVKMRTQRDELLAALKNMNRAYVNLLENGRDRIREFGGPCDPVDVMEASDQNLRESRAVIAKVEGGAA